MQLIWYLPSLLIGITTGLVSGYWQMALVSLLMVGSMLAINLWRNRYPPFNEGDHIVVSLAGVAIANRVLPHRELFWKKNWHHLLLAHFQSRQTPNQLEVMLREKTRSGFWHEGKTLGASYWLGANAEGEVHLNTETDGAHLIIIGPTGSGKSELLKLICLSVLEADSCQLMLFDFKGGACLSEFASQALLFATDMDIDHANDSWRKVSELLIKRERIFQQAGVSSIEQFQLQQELKRVVVVVDELSQALQSSQLASTCIEDICARGRSLGVHLVVAGQSLVGVPRSLLTNLRARIAMVSCDPIDLVQLGMPVNRTLQPIVAGFGSALVMGATRPARDFYFPLGFRPEPRQVALTPSGEPPPPARSQALRQMYLAQEPEQYQPEEPSSSRDSQLLSRMEGLRWSAHR